MGKRGPRRTVVNIQAGLTRDLSDFLWLMTEEPHRSRRLAILKAHPEVESTFVVVIDMLITP
jgi:Sphingolipid Delta4-desaturase (DES)